MENVCYDTDVLGIMCCLYCCLQEGWKEELFLAPLKYSRAVISIKIAVEKHLLIILDF